MFDQLPSLSMSSVDNTTTGASPGSGASSSSTPLASDEGTLAQQGHTELNHLPPLRTSRT